MSILRVGSGPAATPSSTTSLNNAYAPASGNTVVLSAVQYLAGGAAPTLTDPTRLNTIPSPIVNITAGSERLTVWVIPNCIGGAGNWHLAAGGSADLNLDIVEYSGCDPTGALDGTPTTNALSGGVTSISTTTNIVTSQAGSAVIGTYADQSSAHAVTWSGSASLTGVIDNENPDAMTSAYADNVGAASGSYGATVSWSPNTSNGALLALFALKAAGSGAAALASAGTAKSTGTATLNASPLAALAAAGASKASGVATFTTGVMLQAAGGAVSHGSGVLTTGTPAVLAAAGGARAAGAAAFTSWATVTLAGTLFTGRGGILDPSIIWPFNAPVDGSVIEYDGTNVTVLPDCTIVSALQNAQFVAQYFDGTHWNIVTITLTGGMVAGGYARSSGVAALSTSMGWRAAGAGKSTGVAAFTTGVTLAAAGSGVARGTASLSTGGPNPLAAAGYARAIGTSFLTTGSGADGGWSWDDDGITFDSDIYTFDGASPWEGSADVTVTMITSSGALADWAAAANPAVAGYLLRLTPLESAPSIIDTHSATPEWVLAGLSPGTTYELEVAAYDGDGNHSAYQPSNFTFTTLSSTGAARMTPQYVFGPGIGWITPLTDSSGNPIAVSSPILVAAMQDINLDMSAEVKELYGSGSFAIAIGRGKQKMGAKIKNAQVHGALWNNLFFGQSLTNGIYTAVYDSVGTVLSATTVTPTPPNSGTWGYNLGVRDVNNLPLQRVVTGPTAGQYSVSAGVYTFASADVSAAKRVFIDYNYTATSTTATQILLNNLPMGNAPTFQFDLIIPFQGNVFSATLFNCTATKAGLSTKLDDFTMPEFDFSAQAPGGGAIGRLSWSQ